jgi:hypothetical protein
MHISGLIPLIRRGGDLNENGHVTMPQKENTGILDAAPMTLALCFMFCKCTAGKEGGGGRNLSTV